MKKNKNGNKPVRRTHAAARAVSVLLAIAMLISVTACSGESEGEQNSESTVDSHAETETAEDDFSEGQSQPGAESSEAGESLTEITVTDMIGREVTVTPGSYTRVVCIGAGALRMYCYIGDVSLLCGVEDVDNTSLEERPEMFDSVARPYVLAYEEVFADLPSCGTGGPNAQAAEAEKILSCDPDIVISEYEDVEKEDALQEQLGIPVITLRAGKDGVFADAFSDSIKLLGTIFCKEEEAQTLTDYVDAEAAEITARTADIAEEDKPSVYICGLGNWGTTNHLMTSEDYISFRIANVKNAVSGLGVSGPAAIEEEKFVAAGEDMDIIIMDSAAVKNIIPLYEEDSTMFDTCKAWQDGEVYLQMAYNAYYTNYELALVNTWYIAKTVYPELFEDIDMTEKMNEVTQVFLGAELADEIFDCDASYGGYQKIDTETFFER